MPKLTKKEQEMRRGLLAMREKRPLTTRESERLRGLERKRRPEFFKWMRRSV